MNTNETDSVALLYDALNFVAYSSGLSLNETDTLPPSQANWPSYFSAFPLALGFIGLIFNILALLIFTASKTFRQSSFRCYIYAFVLVNCASILTYSWFYLLFYIVDPIYVCKYIQYLQQSLSATSLWIMVLLSIERSFTFVRPLTAKRIIKSRTICFIILLVTCLCFVSHIDELVSVEIKAFRWINFAYGLCSVKRNSRLFTDRIRILTHLHSFILPFLLNSILSIYICYKICQRRKRLVKRSKSTFLIDRFRRSKLSLANEITLTLLCQSMWLLMTFVPVRIYYSIISFNFANIHDRDNSTLVFFIRQNLLIYLAFSPTFYVILSPTLRKDIHSHLCISYRQQMTASSSYISNASRRLEKFINHHHQQRPNLPQQAHSTILITRSEELPRKILSKPIILPAKFLVPYVSKSTPCLADINNEDELSQYQKTERSSTINE